MSARLIQIAAISLGLAMVSVLFSIAISQILLGVALAAYLVSFVVPPRTRFDLPPLWAPLALYMLWTVLSMLLAPPAARHLPQIRKMYVLAIIPVGFSM